jgi:hypothetical protein
VPSLSTLAVKAHDRDPKPGSKVIPRNGSTRESNGFETDFKSEEWTFPDWMKEMYDVRGLHIWHDPTSLP